MIRLFLDNKEIEIDNNTTFPLSKLFENLNNPTEYYSEFSKTIDIPFTQENNKFFSEYYNLDSLIYDFDPSVMVDYILMNDNDILSSGYAYLSNIKFDQNGNTYQICLLGALNKFINDLIGCSFGKELPNLLPSDFKLTSNNVVDCWNNETPNLEFLYDETNNKPIYDLTHKWSDVIQFLPVNNGYLKNFQNDKVIVNGASTIKTIHDQYYPNDKENKTNIDAYIGDGFTERQNGEFRIEYEKPVIYINKLIQLFKNVSQKVSGYSMELDSRFFNSNNPLYTDVVYTLGDLVTDDNSNNINTSLNCQLNAPNVKQFYLASNWIYLGDVNRAATTNGSNNVQSSYLPELTSNDYNTILGNNTFIVPDNVTIKLNYDFNWYLKFKNPWCDNILYRNRKGNINNDNAFIVTVFIQKQTNNGWSTIQTHKHLYYRDGYSTSRNVHWENTNGFVTRQSLEDVKPTDSYKYYNLSSRANGEILVGNNGGVYRVGVSYSFYGNPINNTGYNGMYPYYPFGAYGLIDGSFYGGDSSKPQNNTFKIQWINMKTTASQEVRSNCQLDMKILWKESVSPFSVVLQYCRLMGLVFDFDSMSNKITILKREDYFKDYKIKDWTDKVDTSRGYEIKPLNWDTRYVTFNYNETDGDYLTDYKYKYKNVYGSQKIITNYKINSENNELLCNSDSDRITPSCIESPYINSARNAILKQVDYIQSKEVYVVNHKENKQADIFGAFYFRNLNVNVDSRINNQSYVRICSDSPYEVQSGQYCWHPYNENGNYRMTKIPQLSVYDNNQRFCIQFSIPKELYYEKNTINDLSNVKTMFQNNWQRFIEEQYNKQNKVLTINVHLTCTEYVDLKFNHFVKINDVLYFVNKIKDFKYDNELTKVELIQIYDINNYTGQISFNPKGEPTVEENSVVFDCDVEGVDPIIKQTYEGYVDKTPELQTIDVHDDNTQEDITIPVSLYKNLGDFIGWYDDNDNEFDINTKITEDKIYHAKYEYFTEESVFKFKTNTPLENYIKMTNGVNNRNSFRDARYSLGMMWDVNDGQTRSPQMPTYDTNDYGSLKYTKWKAYFAGLNWQNEVIGDVTYTYLDKGKDLPNSNFASGSISEFNMENTSLRTIPNNFCYSTPEMVSVKLPKRLETIGSGAFAYCGKWSGFTINVPSTVREIGNGAFGHYYAQKGLKVVLNSSEYKYNLTNIRRNDRIVQYYVSDDLYDYYVENYPNENIEKISNL